MLLFVIVLSGIQVVKITKMNLLPILTEMIIMVMAMVSTTIQEATGRQLAA